MRKRPLSLAIQDQILPPPKSHDSDATKSPLLSGCSAPASPGKRRAVGYARGVKPRREPPVLPRLFIRGLGGSIRLDLSGVGLQFSEGAFVHLMTDDSLQCLHVFRGDLALIEPIARPVHSGNLVLLELDGCLVIRRLKKSKRVWMLDSMTGQPQDFVPLIDQGIQGVVFGFMRMLKKLKPIKYEGTDGNFSTCSEKSASRTKKKIQEETPGRLGPQPSIAQLEKFVASNRPAWKAPVFSEVDESVNYLF